MAIQISKWTAVALVVCSTGGWLSPATAAERDRKVPPTLAPRLAAPFADNAVLQQKIKLPVWGTSLPGAAVTVSFRGQTKTAQADARGRWRVALDPMEAPALTSVNDAPTGKTMTVICEKDGERAVRELTNLLVGDVWICAGQSNMAGRMKRPGHPKNYPPNSVNDADYPGLRFLNVEKQTWDTCTPKTVVWCSRVAFFFARRLQKDALVPIGLIVRADGGSNIESWLNRPPYPTGKNYRRLMTPVVGYGIRGTVWYQGESNEKDRRGYQPKLEALVTGWREAWEMGDFPFYFVQLPGISQSTRDNPAMGDGRAEIRQAYVEALALPNTGLAVTIDIGTPGEHPPNKYDTGDRLARAVLHDVYDLKKIGVSPLYKSHEVEGGAIRVSFSNAESGLMLAKKQGRMDFQPPTPTPDAELGWLSIQDKDGTWHWAEGKIDGSELLVSCKDVKKPVAIRYAYTTHPTGPLLYSKDGLPVGPFSTNGYGPKTASKESP